MTLRFMAGSMGVPFLPTFSGLGSDILEKWGFTSELRESNKSLPSKKIISIQNPFSTEDNPIVLVPAVNPDVAILHVQKASAEGSTRIEGLSFADIEQARAAKYLIVSCEEVVPNEELRLNSNQNAFPHVLVDAVVHQPNGAHPTACYNHYDYDMIHLNAYRNLAKNDSQFHEYVETYILGVESFNHYLDLIGDEQLHAIKASRGEGYSRRCTK
jgi:glutaconate CoA-transferase subunit A